MSFLFLILSLAEAAPCCTLVNNFTLKNAGFLSVTDPPTPNSTEPALLISSFSPYGSDGIYYVQNLKTLATTNQTAKVTEVSDSVVWPNQVTGVPKNALKGWTDHSAVVADGFIFQGKTTGSVTIFDLDSTNTSKPYVLSVPKTDYFYHQVTWTDINGDGLLDILAARGINGGTGELVWLQQPAQNPLTATSLPWTETVLTPGPDVFIAVSDIDKDGKDEVIAAQYFTKQLTLYWCPTSPWSTCNSSTTKSLIIDNTIGALFGVEVSDLNHDGKLDLLVTNNANDGSGSVYAYEIPTDPKNSKANSWTRHTLITGISPPIKHIPGQGAPGNVLSFHKNVTNTNEKPWIIFSGDDAGSLILLTPKTTSTSDWTYNSEVIYQASGTTGEVTVSDVDGDGIVEIIVAEYAENGVRIYRFL